MKDFLKYALVYMPAGLAVIFAGFAVQAFYLEPHAGYRAFVAAAARVGPSVATAAAIILVLDLASMVIYALRHGKTDASQGSVVDDGPMPLGLGPQMGRSRRKILVSTNEYISMESLVTGTATPGERMMVAGIFVLYLSFFCIFVGGGLLLMQDFVLAIAAPVLPGLMVGNLIHESWADYRKVKAKLRREPGAR